MRENLIWKRFAGALLAYTLILLGAVPSAQAAVGRTPGNFVVSQTGAATYTIPIWAPRGPGGVQPNLALVYNSQLGNSTLGVGWRLSGLSSIYRCPLTYAQDGTAGPIALSTTDGLCMDGKRLRLTSGTQGVAGSTYQTEIADFSNVAAVGVAGNGPASFSVRARNGWTYEYGNGGYSQVLATGTPTASQWMVDKVTDRAGNTMIITYSTNSTTGMVVPNTIAWTPTSHGATSYSYTMVFGYGTAPPQTSKYGYVAGTAVVNTNLLTTITINYGSVVKEYFLGYQASPTTGRFELIQVQECADSGQSNCLAPTVVTYQSGAQGVSGVNSLGTYATGGQPQSFSAYDLNGDGRNDLVWYDSGGWHVAFATSTGFSAPVSAGIAGNAIAIECADGSGVDGILAPVSGAWWYYKWNGSSFVGTSTGVSTTGNSTVASSFALADLNGDGLADLITIGTDGYLYVRLHTSNSASVSFSATATKTVAIPAAHGIQSGFNGTRHLDFFGTGQQDLVSYYAAPTGPYFVVYHFNGTTFADLGAYTVGTVDLADYNDDGCTDNLSAYDLELAECNGQPPTNIGLGTAMAVGGMDWDGDGRRDILVANGATLGVYKSLGYGPSATLTTTAIPYSPGMQGDYATVHNATGDGLDALAVFNDSSSSAVQYYLHNGAGQPPDLVSSITDGYGNSETPTYASIAQSDFTAGTSAVYPNENYTGPIYVVNQVSYSDPSSTTNGTYNQTFSYVSAWMNLQGRGFEGFETVYRQDSRNGLWDKFGYDVVFPYTGLLDYDLTSKDQAGAQQVRFSYNNRTSTQLDGTPNNQRTFVYFNNSTTQTNEVGGTKDGQLIKTVSTHYTFDTYGNPITVASTVTDNVSSSPYFGVTWTTTVTNTPDIDTVNWCLTLQTQTQVVYSASNASPSSPITRTQHFIPDTSNCRLTEIVTEPSSATYKVTEDIGYDSFGNVNSDTVTGIGMTARLTTANWGTTGQFPMVVTDASGATTQRNYNFSYGLSSSLTDGNGLTTSWQYTDGFGRLTKEILPDGAYNTFVYNDCVSDGGCVIGSHTLALSHFRYNVDGTIQTDGTIYLDALERRVMDNNMLIDGVSWGRTDYRYDSLGRLTQQSFRCVYTAVTTPCPYMQTTSYDILNRPTQSSRPVSATNSTLQTQTTTYEGDTVVSTDPYGMLTTKIMTPVGTLGRSQDNNGYYQNFAYDAANSLTGVTDSLSHTLISSSYDYGIQPFLRSSTDIDLGVRSFTYDALGEATHWSDAKGKSFSASYDALSRMTDRYEPDLYSHWVWGTSATAHEIGKLHSTCSGLGTNPTTCTSSPGYSQSEIYDSLGRQSQRVMTIPSDPTPSYTYTWQYNTNTGLLQNLTYPAVYPTTYALELQYNYANGILASITDITDSPNVAIWTANAENPRGQVTQETLGNGVVVNRSYDAVTGLVASLQAGVSGGTALQNQSYLFDEMGNLIQRQDNNHSLTESFCYDNLYRLDHSTLTGSCSGTTNLQMTYDQMGNITKKSDVATTSWTYDTTHIHQVKTAGSNTYTYDANGNMVTYQGGGAYPIQWNGANYPTLLTFGSSTDTIAYNQSRQRYYQKFVSTTGTETTYYAGKLLEKVTQTTGTVAWRHYVFAGHAPVAIVSRQNSATTISYVLKDHLGSTSAFVNSAGAAQVNESFRAFGVERSPTDWVSNTSSADTTTIAGISRHGFTFESTLTNPGTFSGMMVHLNGRVLDGFIGRLLSADPVNQDMGNTQSFNRYTYVNNNPLTFTDPSGYCGVDEGEELVEICHRPPGDFGPSAPDGSPAGSPGGGASKPWPAGPPTITPRRGPVSPRQTPTPPTSPSDPNAPATPPSDPELPTVTIGADPQFPSLSWVTWDFIEDPFVSTVGPVGIPDPNVCYATSKANNPQTGGRMGGGATVGGMIGLIAGGIAINLIGFPETEAIEGAALFTMSGRAALGYARGASTMEGIFFRAAAQDNFTAPAAALLRAGAQGTAAGGIVGLASTPGVCP